MRVIPLFSIYLTIYSPLENLFDHIYTNVKLDSRSAERESLDTAARSDGKCEIICFIYM